MFIYKSTILSTKVCLRNIVQKNNRKLFENQVLIFCEWGNSEYNRVGKTNKRCFEFSLSVFSHSHWYFKISKSFLSLFSLFFIHTLRKTLHSIVNPWRTVKALDVAFRTWWTTHKRKYFICIYFLKNRQFHEKKLKIYIFLLFPGICWGRSNSQSGGASCCRYANEWLWKPYLQILWGCTDLLKKYFQKNSIFLFLEGTYPKSRQKTTTTTTQFWSHLLLCSDPQLLLLLLITLVKKNII